MVMEPKVLLLDEPLSNLDARLRLEMRTELQRVQRETGVTMIFVTHDQTEALALADRIVVIRDGAIEQVGSPEEIYDRPASRFVADFVGFENIYVVRDGRLHSDRGLVPFTGELPKAAALAFRPRSVALGAGPLSGTVRGVSFAGGARDYVLETAFGSVKAEAPAGAARLPSRRDDCVRLADRGRRPPCAGLSRDGRVDRCRHGFRRRDGGASRPAAPGARTNRRRTRPEADARPQFGDKGARFHAVDGEGRGRRGGEGRQIDVRADGSEPFDLETQLFGCARRPPRVEPSLSTELVVNGVLMDMVTGERRAADIGLVGPLILGASPAHPQSPEPSLPLPPPPPPPPSFLPLSPPPFFPPLSLPPSPLLSSPPPSPLLRESHGS